MSTNLYITATEPRSGKTTVVLGVMQMLLKSLDKVAFFRPVIDDTETGWEDPTATLILEHFDLDYSYEESYGCLLSQAREMIQAGREDHLHEKILKKYNSLKNSADFILCDGSDFRNGDVGFENDLNVELAAHLGAPVLLVLSGLNRDQDELVVETQRSLETMIARGVDPVGCILTRCNQEIDIRAFGHLVPIEETIFYINEHPELSNPTVANLKQMLGARAFNVAEGMDAPVLDYLLAGMLPDTLVSRITPGAMVIASGDRSDIIYTCLASRMSTNCADIAGVLLTGGSNVSPSVVNLIKGLDSKVALPVLAVDYDEVQLLERVQGLYGHLAPQDTKRIATAIGEFSKSVDLDRLSRKVIAQVGTTVTPKMFEFGLMEKASKKLQRIVLPEGSCDRILQAADILLRRGVANLVLLGDEDEIRMRAAGCGLDLKWVEIIDPLKSSLLDGFVAEYLELRKHKGVIEDVARDRMSDPTYFGTMMVHKGLADGMVSGAENTTAHTIRPSFEFIKTKPGISVVSSVFLMCLKDRVLVYGDCAVNPNPTAGQLAEIAICSAHTARVFGIEPRVALLSYSTGGSGKGEDVEKIVEATSLAQQRLASGAESFSIEGPLQYDAAIDPAVAETKMVASQVAGRATVFIFPDLNTGNNTYKAVQRSAEAVAIGPILQGLNKPVNDLSRGCMVDDIVNTVAITAIQAQAENEVTT